MPRISAAEFLAYLWIEPLPETGEILRHLHWPLVGRKQVDHHIHLSIGDRRRFAHAEEVLQAGGDPGRLIGGITHARPEPPGQADALPRHLLPPLSLIGV